MAGLTFRITFVLFQSGEASTVEGNKHTHTHTHTHTQITIGKAFVTEVFQHDQ